MYCGCWLSSETWPSCSPARPTVCNKSFAGIPSGSTNGIAILGSSVGLAAFRLIQSFCIRLVNASTSRASSSKLTSSTTSPPNDVFRCEKPASCCVIALMLASFSTTVTELTTDPMSRPPAEAGPAPRRAANRCCRAAGRDRPSAAGWVHGRGQSRAPRTGCHRCRRPPGS